MARKLSRSRIFKDYEKAFGDATGLPLTLTSHEVWNIAQHGHRNENPFCALMAKASRSCAACLDVQHRLSDGLEEAPRTAQCFAGLCDSAVPLRVGDKLVGVLRTGQVFLQKPTRAGFARTAEQLLNWGIDVDFRQAEETYFQTRVLSTEQYEAMIRLLTIFAQHLSMVANQIVVQEANAEPVAITRARQFIVDHQADDLSLKTVADAVNMSTFYFCKMFKKATGLNFTDYLSRIRIEKAKNLLLNPNLRVSEIAYEVGFGSLTHFNRSFHKIVGRSPSEYRRTLGKRG